MVDFTVLGAGGHQGTASIETLVDDVWNTDLEYGLASKRNIDRVLAVETDSERLQNLEEELNLNEWQLVKENGRKAYENPDLDTVIELVERDAADYLQYDFEGGVVYDGTWTTEREDVAEALADRIEFGDTALLTESSASLFEKPSEPARDPIHRLQALGLPMSENQVEMFSDQKRSVIDDIRRNDARVESIETYRISSPEKMVETERNLLKNNEGSTIDKGAHDWGKILATLSASGQVEEDSEVVLDEEESEYRVARVEEGGQDIIYTAKGEEICGSDLEGLSFKGQRLNDGYAEIVAGLEDVDLKVVTGLTGIPEKVRRRAEDLERNFQVPDESEIDVVEGLDIDEDDLNAVNTADLVFDYEGNEEIRAEYVETDQADYLVSTATGGEMFTLKMMEDGLELLAYGPSDWHASFLEEGIDAVENNAEPTVDIGTALETGRINLEVARQAYRNARGKDATVRVSQYDGLDEVLGLEEEYSSESVPVREKKSSAEI